MKKIYFTLSLTVLTIAGCSSSAFDKGINLEAGCDLTCKKCGEVKLKCSQDNSSNKNHKEDKQGTVSGSSIGQ